MIAHPKGVVVVAVTAALLLFLSSCRSRPHGPKGSLVSVSFPLSSYVRINLNGGADEGAKFFFPQLEIYDESGFLIYSSHDSVGNARVLEDLAGGIQRFPPNPNGPRLAEIVETFPAFQKRKEEILGQHRVSVLSIFLQDCHACRIQENALDSAERRLLDRGINLLTIHLSRPGV